METAAQLVLKPSETTPGLSDTGHQLDEASASTFFLCSHLYQDLWGRCKVVIGAVGGRGGTCWRETRKEEKTVPE